MNYLEINIEIEAENDRLIGDLNAGLPAERVGDVKAEGCVHMIGVYY